MAHRDAGSRSHPPLQWRINGSLLEQNDERAITRRYMTLETVAAICDAAPMGPAKIAAL